MNKITGFLASAAMLCSLNANAGFYLAYEQDFQSASSISEIPEIKSNGALNLCKLADGVKGNVYFDFDLGANNARSSHFWWGPDSWTRAEEQNDGKDNYKVQMQLLLTQGNDIKKEQRNLSFAISSNEEEVAEDVAYFNFVTSPKRHELFSLTLLVDSVEQEDGTYVQQNSPKYAVMGDSLNAIRISAGTWYDFELTVNSETREAKWSLTDPTDDFGDPITGKYTIPDSISYKATGIYMLANRASSHISIDNLFVGKYVKESVAVKPSAKLVDLGDTFREWKYFFKKGEVLKYEITGCSEGSVFDSQGEQELPLVGELSYAEVQNNTNSLMFTENCHVKIWTSIKSSESDPFEFDVEIAQVVLPEPTAKITAVEEGYGKSFMVSVDNSQVPTNPAIAYDFIFTPADGSEPIEGQSIASGVVQKIDKPGTLKFRATYGKCTESDWVTVINDTPYNIVKSLDFEHMTPEFLAERNITEQAVLESSNTSGWDNWTARRRIFDYIGVDMSKEYKEEDFEDAEDAVKEEAQKAWNDELAAKTVAMTKMISYYYKESIKDSVEAAGFFENMTLWWSGSKSNRLNVCQRVGLVESDLSMGNDRTIFITEIPDDMFALVYKINNYGGNSMHYFCDTEEEALAKKHGELLHVLKGVGSFLLYRIDTSISCIDFLEAGEPAEVEDPDKDEDNAIPSVVADDVNSPVYDLLGRKVNANAPGLKIQNGKLVK